MDLLNELQPLLNAKPITPDLTLVLTNFFLCITMAFIVRWFYTKHSFSTNEKLDIASVIPTLAAIMFLVIIIVKSSLALSLGVFGALSIVRFRTPIKEPEELVYLFLAIALGLGYGGGFSVITTVIVLLTLLIIYFLLSNKKLKKIFKYNLTVKWLDDKVSFDRIIKDVKRINYQSKLIKFNSMNESSSIEFEICTEEPIDIDSLINELEVRDRSINFSLNVQKNSS